MISIAIDGPSGAGKSTLARSIAQKLGYLYVDTGALYRAIGLGVLRAGKNTKDEQQVAALLGEMSVSLVYQKGEQRVLLNNEDVSVEIRQENVSMAASDVSAHAPVRDFLLDTQRRLARENNVVMDGRDIGTVVLPNAQVKIFLTASVEERARRRWKQLTDTGAKADFETVKKDVEQRDYNDTHRAIAPLKQADDAILADTTNLDFEQSEQLLLDIVKKNTSFKEKEEVLKPLKTIYLVLYYIIFCLAQVVVRIVYPIRTIGKENLTKSEGYVLACNHLRAIDPLYVLLARGLRKKMLIMGKEELFNHGWLLNFFWSVTGAFPVDRGKGDRNLVESAVQEVRKGRGLLIFPEGTRSKDGNLGRLKSGAFVVALEAGADIIPCRIWYKAGKAKPFSRITVIFGEPLSVEELGLTGQYSASKLRQAKSIFREKLETLYETNKHKL